MGELEREYWRIAQRGLSVSDYPEIDDDSVEFPPSAHIVFVVCSKECGNTQFIVDGSTQICEKCGKMMFRTAVKEYRIKDESMGPLDDPIAVKHGIWLENPKD